MARADTEAVESVALVIAVAEMEVAVAEEVVDKAVHRWLTTRS